MNKKKIGDWVEVLDFNEKMQINMIKKMIKMIKVMKVIILTIKIKQD